MPLARTHGQRLTQCWEAGARTSVAMTHEQAAEDPDMIIVIPPLPTVSLLLPVKNSKPKQLQNYPIQIHHHILKVDLNILPINHFDIILRKDWLTEYQAQFHRLTKTVQLTIPEIPFSFPSHPTKSYLPVKPRYLSRKATCAVSLT